MINYCLHVGGKNKDSFTWHYGYEQEGYYCQDCTIDNKRAIFVRHCYNQKFVIL